MANNGTLGKPNARRNAGGTHAAARDKVVELGEVFRDLDWY